MTVTTQIIARLVATAAESLVEQVTAAAVKAYGKPSLKSIHKDDGNTFVASTNVYVHVSIEGRSVQVSIGFIADDETPKVLMTVRGTTAKQLVTRMKAKYEKGPIVQKTFEKLVTHLE